MRGMCRPCRAIGRRRTDGGGCVPVRYERIGTHPGSPGDLVASATPAAVAAAAAAAPAPAVAAAAPAATAAPVFPGLGLVDGQGTPLDLLAVQAGNRRLGLL